jgi:Spy/CpxP family protein refolding chaperone
MKTSQFFAIVLGALLLAGTGNAFSQARAGRPGMKGVNPGKNTNAGIPQLTEDQRKQIKDLRLSFMKEIQPLRNQLGELRAKQKSLTTAAKPDMKAIDANIDEVSKVQNQMMKKTAEVHQQVRAVLNDEQKLWFDTHPNRMMQKRHFNKPDRIRRQG